MLPVQVTIIFSRLFQIKSRLSFIGSNHVCISDLIWDLYNNKKTMIYMLIYTLNFIPKRLATCLHCCYCLVDNNVLLWL